jgi:hypothetical protein
MRKTIIIIKESGDSQARSSFASTTYTPIIAHQPPFLAFSSTFSITKNREKRLEIPRETLLASQ